MALERGSVGGHQTLLYRQRDGIAHVTLNRPAALNMVDDLMAAELAALWRGLQHDDDVRCVILTGAGERAFCAGIDHDEPSTGRQWVLGPKSNDLKKPVVAAVHGIACREAFFLLAEADYVIATHDSTFFEPPVGDGKCGTFAPVHLLERMPIQEVLRMALLSRHERMTAQRALEVGLVSQVVANDELIGASTKASHVIMALPPLGAEGSDTR
jgi:enoyl-CoA hydratase/carnithine racemase